MFACGSTARTSSACAGRPFRSFAGSALSPYVFLPLYNGEPSHAFVACAAAACLIAPLAIAIRTLPHDELERLWRDCPLISLPDTVTRVCLSIAMSIPGGMIADLIPTFGSVNMIGGECDR